MYPQHVIYFAQFLDTFPGDTGREAVRRVDLPLFGRRPVESERRNSYIEFMANCGRLWEVRVKFEVWWLVKNGLGIFNNQDDGDADGDEQILNRNAIVQRYGLEDMFDIPSLSTLIIEVWPKVIKQTKEGMRLGLPDCWPAMENLAVWMREGFEERERSVDVRIVESGNPGLTWAGSARQSEE